ncbi:hypothetical protein ACS3SW_19845 [Roseobacteraceae bacterium S113]
MLISFRTFAMALAAVAIPALSSALSPVELAPINHADAALVVVSPNGEETSYTPAELESFATYSMTTTTPWREEPAQFEGVLLSDILAMHGLDAVTSIQVTAENDYTTTLERELLDSVTIMVATRVDGRPHSRRARGPIQFVIDSDAFSSSELTSESNFVWMAARIEVGQ